MARVAGVKQCGVVGAVFVVAGLIAVSTNPAGAGILLFVGAASLGGGLAPPLVQAAAGASSPYQRHAQALIAIWSNSKAPDRYATAESPT